MNLSAIYASSTGGKLKVAYSVPIAAENIPRKQVLGVLVMSIELGEIGVLDTDLHSGQIVLLVDSRTDMLSGVPRRRLILQHPNLSQAGDPPNNARIDEALLEQIDGATGGGLLRGFSDPLADGTGLAFYEPVVVTRRRAPASDTGWIVLVREPLEAAKP